MTEHVYVVVQSGGETDGVTLSVYSDAVSAINDARSTAENRRWTVEMEGGQSIWPSWPTPPRKPYRLLVAHDEATGESVEVQQRPVKPAREAASVTVTARSSDAGLAQAVIRQLDWTSRP